MTCLKGQEEKREASSLHSQLSHFVFLPKEDGLYQEEDVKARQTMLEALSTLFQTQQYRAHLTVRQRGSHPTGPVLPHQLGPANV